MAESDSRTQIVIACISLVGVLAAAVIANWGKISGKGTVAKGSIRYGATIWSDLATRQLFKTFELADYCYAFD